MITFLLSSGTCWGSYMVLRLSSCPSVSAGVSMHPSHSGIIKILGEDEEKILNEIQVCLFALSCFIHV
jgi:hypothetical protein